MQGERQGMKHYMQRSSPTLRNQLRTAQPSRPKAVSLVVEDLRKLIKGNPALQAELEGEDQDLLEILTDIQNR
jgi:hypothetical protein